ncbi:hypothetical protein Drose_04025 [Dactylosporangium roseum]|uniref:Uncharacterized protein n=1 Tax=Dactylosporangium roseum TaxID=47989 RepID=A0ABY5Z792_9ACTN|nr:hypothetical protein [Dactylosporangium roseum]UWZ37456.1 hypothetical protein Drose_04025 [Dactylosporangium roseum]
MESTAILAWIHATDGRREVWPVGRYLVDLDLAPSAVARTADRLNRIAEQVAADDLVHGDPGRYQVEVVDFHSRETLFRWIYTPDGGL